MCLSTDATGILIRTTGGASGGSAYGGAFVTHFGREDATISVDVATGAQRGRALDVDEARGLLHWGVGSVGRHRPQHVAHPDRGRRRRRFARIVSRVPRDALRARVP